MTDQYRATEEFMMCVVCKTYTPATVDQDGRDVDTCVWCIADQRRDGQLALPEIVL